MGKAKGPDSCIQEDQTTRGSAPAAYGEEPFVPGTAMTSAETSRYAQAALDMLDVREGEVLALELASDEQIPFAAALALEAAERNIILEVINPVYSISDEELEARRERIEALAENDAKFLALVTGDNVDPSENAIYSTDHINAESDPEHSSLRKQWEEAVKAARYDYTNQTERWSLTPWPTRTWAAESTDGDLRALSEHLIRAVRADEPGAAKKHMETLRRRGKELTEAKIEEVRIQDDSGTDLRMRVATGAHFQAVDFQSNSNDPSRRHFVNLNTDEVFTTPDYRSVSGTICSQYPVTLADRQGRHKIHQIKATYEDGEMIAAAAYNPDGSVDSRGTEIMNNFFVRKPMGRLGELGLCDNTGALAGSGVDFDSSEVNEDAVVCHVATGSHYAKATGGRAEELNEGEGGRTLGHIDWGIGGLSATVTGTSRNDDGSTTPITLIEQGRWAERFR